MDAVTVGVLTLAGFLLARIAEDEAIAHSAREHNPTPWVADTLEFSPNVYTGGQPDSAPICWAEDSGNGEMESVAAIHIAHHDPARVLAECEAKRRIVDAALDVYRHHAIEADDYADDGRQYIWTVAERWDHVLSLLALPFANHPDYREEWRP